MSLPLCDLYRLIRDRFLIGYLPFAPPDFSLPQCLFLADSRRTASADFSRNSNFDPVSLLRKFKR
jgi:hypothetical protein